MRKRLKGIQGRVVGNGAGVAALGTLGMSAAIVIWLRAMQGSAVAITTLGGIAVGVVIYGLILILFRLPEIQIFLHWIKRRFPKITPQS